MNNARTLQIGALVVLAAVALFLLTTRPNEPQESQSNYTGQQPIQQASVIVDTPQPDDLITSPLVVKGRAVGSWYFEANLPVTLKDTNGNVLAQEGFRAISDWMTTGYVDFDGTLIFTTPATQYGVLIISKDNPSGLPQNDTSFAVPVRFR